MSLNDFIVNVFCETDDVMKEFFPERILRRRQVSDDLHVKKIRARHLWHLDPITILVGWLIWVKKILTEFLKKENNADY